MKRLLLIVASVSLCFGIASMASAGTFPKDVFSEGYDGNTGIYDNWGNSYNDNDIKTIDGNDVTFLAKVEKNGSSGGFSVYYDSETRNGRIVYDKTNGTWTAPTGVQVDYITVKAGNGFIVYDVAKMSNTWSTVGLGINKNGEYNTPNLSHITFWAKNSSSVPVPAAVWLLGTGLAGLIGIRRKMKK